MKRAKSVKLALFFAGILSITGTLNAVDTESHLFIDRLLRLQGPGAPEIFEDAVIFTASSSLRRVGVSFANEGFSKVYWLRQLLIPQDPLGAPLPEGKKSPDPYKDSGVLFYVHPVPDGVEELEYRMVVNGLWTTDPANPSSRRDKFGISTSVVSIPRQEEEKDLNKGPPGSLNFRFEGPPGETVTVAGSFNGWDPFMYELREYPAGLYSLSIPLPPGTYQYVFYHRGERCLDPFNFRRAYTKEGISASEAVIN
ncbi:MAG: isoamylase [Treponema sp.]|jgi:hypothetical protein|nr:isoamylase [Treponema sp.]